MCRATGEHNVFDKFEKRDTVRVELSEESEKKWAQHRGNPPRGKQIYIYIYMKR